MAWWEQAFWGPVEGNFQPVYDFTLEISSSLPTVTATGRLLFDIASTAPTIMFDDGSVMRLVPVMTTSGDVVLPGTMSVYGNLGTVTNGVVSFLVSSGQVTYPLITSDPGAGPRKFLVVNPATGIMYLSTGVEP